jgi:hypothetical protein
MSRDLPPGRRVPESDPGDRESSPAGTGRDDQSGLPPFVSTWGGFYRLVLFTFLGFILLFYAIQAAFR